LTAEHIARYGWIRRLLLSLVLVGFAALSWSGKLDSAALNGTDVTFKRALAAFAVSRSLNGVISVAQGTEIAIQPVGVGVTLSVGEILDPLNDLVERFSWLVLLACASLGSQMLLAEIMSNFWLSAVLSITVLLGLTALWWPGRFPGSSAVLRLCALVIFVRFLVAAVALTSAWVDQATLAQRQDTALGEIVQAQESIEDMRREPALRTDAQSESMLDRFSDFLDDQRQTMNIEAQIEALSERVEGAINQFINLIVLFTVQTIVIPLATLWAAFAALRWTWNRTWS